jgi:hypothetical protein
MKKKKAVALNRPAPKTEAEIKAEIAALQEIKPKVRRYSAFGDDHHAAIDLQIHVLELDLDWSDIEEYAGEEYDAASETIQWREGSATESLVENWRPLVKE